MTPLAIPAKRMPGYILPKSWVILPQPLDELSSKEAYIMKKQNGDLEDLYMAPHIPLPDTLGQVKLPARQVSRFG